MTTTTLPGATGETRAPTLAALSWRVLHDPPRSGAWNMAIDHALASNLRVDEAVLRLYDWESPTVSFGRNEPAAGRYSPERATELGIDLVRRPTGGRAVLHDAELTYSVVAPMRRLGGARAGYVEINRALASALQSLGAPVTMSVTGGIAPLASGPCFQSPAQGEVVSEGRKLVGSAQARVDGALLQHGSILLSEDQSRLATICVGDDWSAAPAGGGNPVTLDALVSGVGSDQVAAAVTREMENAFRGTWSVGAYRSDELETAEQLVATRYGTEGWTWRR